GPVRPGRALDLHPADHLQREQTLWRGAAHGGVLRQPHRPRHGRGDRPGPGIGGCLTMNLQIRADSPPWTGPLAWGQRSIWNAIQKVGPKNDRYFNFTRIARVP